MLERRRRNKHYDIVPGEDQDGEEEVDVELGNVRRDGDEGVGEQETGTVGMGGESEQLPAEAGAAMGAGAAKATNVTEELDNWDENDEDWDDGDDVTAATTKEEEANGGAVDPEPKKRVD